MDEIYDQLVVELGILRVKLGIPLSEYVLTRVGGPARFLYMATTQRELIRAVLIAQKLKLMCLVVGCGSKVSFGPEGFNGLVIKNRVEAMKIFGIKGKINSLGLGVEEAMLEAESGVSLNNLSQFADKQKLTGLESLSQLQGSLGGSLKNLNNISKFVSQVKVLTKTNDIAVKQISDLEMHDIILSVVFRLKAKS